MRLNQNGPEQDYLRLRIWEAHSNGDSYGVIAAREKMARSTVQYIVKAIKDSGRISAGRSSGRPQKLSSRCVSHQQLPEYSTTLLPPGT